MRLTPTMLVALAVISVTMPCSAHVGSRVKAGHMLGKAFFWESDNSTWDTTGWAWVQRYAGTQRPDSTLRSPRAACREFDNNGKAFLKVKNPTAISVAVLHDLGYKTLFLTQWGFITSTQIRFMAAGADNEYMQRTARTDLTWEMLSRVEMSRPTKLERQHKVRLYYESGGVNMYDALEIVGRDLPRQIAGTTDGLVLEMGRQELFEDQVVKRTVFAVYLIVDTDKAKPGKIAREIEDTFDKMKLDLSYKAPEIVLITCKD